MKFVDVYATSESLNILFNLLLERPKSFNISHRKMPTWEEHRKFVASKPYLAWYIIDADPGYVGAIYLSEGREIGVGVFKDHQRKGYARRAIKKLMRLHPGKFYGNVAPDNHGSKTLFQNLGFKHIQSTYETSG